MRNKQGFFQIVTQTGEAERLENLMKRPLNSNLQRLVEACDTLPDAQRMALFQAYQRAAAARNVATAEEDVATAEEVTTTNRPGNPGCR